MKALVITIFILVVSGLAHGVNMFGFPYYENDEGVYLSQAWSIINQGKLAPYTYWYDHAPVGWLFTSLWLVLTRDLFLFDFSLNSGRVFMLVIHVLSSLILLRLGKKMTGSYLPGSIAAVLFSFSPLGLYFQRRLLLDNLMMFWILLAFYLVYTKTSRITIMLLSAAVFGIAVLTKENAIFFIPGFLATLFYCSHTHHRKIVVLQWLFVVGAVVSVYFLFALLSGEFFPYGTKFLGGESPHVSLMSTLKYQYSRKGGSVTDPTSSIRHNFDLWTQQDALLIYLGLFSLGAITLYSIIKKRAYIGLCLLGIFFCWFLIRGGIVIEFYVVPLVPLFAFYIGLLIYKISQRLHKSIQMIIFFIVLGYGVYAAQYSWAFAQGTAGYKIFSSHQTTGQLEAIDWIHKYVSTDSFIVIDNYAWLQLHDPKNPSGLVYPNAHWYWKIDQDPAIRDTLLAGDPSRIDYIAKTPQMTGDLAMGMSPTTNAALANSSFVKGFNTEGWGVEIWATQFPKQILARSWQFYKARFLKNGVQSVDSNNTNSTTSEGQSYALLRSVWLEDKVTFADVWKWTKETLQKPDGTFAWTLTNDGSASDADVDIAMALILAEKRWPDEGYLDEAIKIINGIWTVEVGSYGKTNYLLPGNWAQTKSQALVNPSYFSPAAFKLFGVVDPGRDWSSLVDSSYAALTTCTTSPLDKKVSADLPPNWCVLNELGQAIQPLEPGTNSTEYSYDAVRVMWRIALDYEWFEDPRAKEYLELSGRTLKKIWENDKRLLVGYTHDGLEWEKYESPVGYAAAISNFSVTDPELAKEIYEQKLRSKFYEDFSDTGVKSYWEDENNYYTQNWVWFATALYSHELQMKF